MPKKGSHQPKSYPTDMAHPIGTERFLYKPRHRKIRSRSAWSLLEFTWSLSHLFIHFIRVYSSEFRLGCPGSRVKCQTVQLSTRVATNRSHSLTLGTRGPSSPSISNSATTNSKSLHIYIYIYPIQIADSSLFAYAYLSDSSFIAYAHLSGSMIESIHESFSFFVMLSVSIPNYH